jgi:hypothetical protein
MEEFGDNRVSDENRNRGWGAMQRHMLSNGEMVGRILSMADRANLLSDLSQVA